MYSQRFLLALTTVLFLVCTTAKAEDATVTALREEVATLKSRLQALEALVHELAPAGVSLTEVAVAPAERMPEAQTDPGTLPMGAIPQEEAASELASAATDDTSTVENGIDIGGALRFNVIYNDDDDSSAGKRGESGLDALRLNIDGSLDNILISAEYRFYSYMDVLHHGWIGYEFADDSVFQFGINQVPFGLLPYASHNSWFGVPYYIGMADDYDMGAKYLREDGPWSSQLAFYKNEELNDATNLDRYSFDLVRVEDQQNEETNQVNARLAYTFGLDTGCETELGGSLEAGQVYNKLTNSHGHHRSYALHMDSRCGRWNLQLQGGKYRYDVDDPEGVDDDTVLVGAFAGAYAIDAEANVYVANVAYNFASPWVAVDSITCYNDYSMLDKSLSGATDSQINTLGCAIGSGPLFTYVDYILARNMPYFGDGSLAGGGEDNWQGRLNINIGYYW